MAGKPRYWITPVRCAQVPARSKTGNIILEKIIMARNITTTQSVFQLDSRRLREPRNALAEFLVITRIKKIAPGYLYRAAVRYLSAQKRYDKAQQEVAFGQGESVHDLQHAFHLKQGLWRELLSAENEAIVAFRRALPDESVEVFDQEDVCKISNALMGLPEGQYLEYLVARFGTTAGYKAWMAWRTSRNSLPGEDGGGEA